MFGSVTMHTLRLALASVLIGGLTIVGPAYVGAPGGSRTPTSTMLSPAAYRFTKFERRAETWCNRHDRKCHHLRDWAYDRQMRRYRHGVLGHARLSRQQRPDALKHAYKRLWRKHYGPRCARCTIAERQQIKTSYGSRTPAAASNARIAWRRFKGDGSGCAALSHRAFPPGVEYCTDEPLWTHATFLTLGCAGSAVFGMVPGATPFWMAFGAVSGCGMFLFGFMDPGK